MSADWDNGTVAHDPAFWAEVLRVCKPGGFLLAFGGPRTYHRLACAIEDAGWECRDMITWLFATGFPKSKSCLKPAHEPILLAKAPGPLQPLQIDACRVLPSSHEDNARALKKPADRAKFSATYSPMAGDGAGWDGQQGRWPPNTLLSHHPDCRPTGAVRVPSHGNVSGNEPSDWTATVYGEPTARRPWTAHGDGDGYETVTAYHCVEGCPVAELDRQAAPSTSRKGQPRAGRNGNGWGMTATGAEYEDAGGPSRFFPTFPGPDPEDAVPFRYQSKASRRDRGEGNTHPTCKSTELMRWLCRLVTPPGGVILDPFAGSGSTAVAARREGFHFIAIEQEPAYVEIMRQRLAAEREKCRDRDE